MYLSKQGYKDLKSILRLTSVEMYQYEKHRIGTLRHYLQCKDFIYNIRRECIIKDKFTFHVNIEKNKPFKVIFEHVDI